jgi:hypothetical protein
MPAPRFRSLISPSLPSFPSVQIPFWFLPGFEFRGNRESSAESKKVSTGPIRLR